MPEITLLAVIGSAILIRQWIAQMNPNPGAPQKFPDWLPEKWWGAYIGYLQQYTHNVNLMRWFLGAEDNVTIKAVDLNDNGYTGVVILDMNGIRVTLETGHISHYRWDEHSQDLLSTRLDSHMGTTVVVKEHTRRSGDIPGRRRTGNFPTNFHNLPGHGHTTEKRSILSKTYTPQNRSVLLLKTL